MFKCHVCKESIGPGVKPIRVVLNTRASNYHNEYFVEDEWGNREKREVDSIGWEIAKEALVCPKDAQEQFAVEEQNHTPSVEKIGRSFREKLPAPFKVPMITSVVHTALARTSHDSKRANADCMVSVPGIKAFVDLNPKFVF